MNIKRLFKVGVPVAGLALLREGFSHRLSMSYYRLQHPKVTESVRFVVLTDLHNHYFGEQQKDLLKRVEAEAPDYILLVGDIFDSRWSAQAAQTLILALVERYPVYYVTGNHEFEYPSIQRLKNWLTRHQVTVLAGDTVKIQHGTMDFTISGVDDPNRGRRRIFKQQLKRIDRQLPSDTYNILLSHQPQRIKEYTQYPLDLIVSGHAHGGQIRIPWANQGLYAPQQGFRPLYTQGLHQLPNHAYLIISRGLAYATTRIPRLFNRPEVVVIDLLK